MLVFKLKLWAIFHVCEVYGLHVLYCCSPIIHIRLLSCTPDGYNKKVVYATRLQTTLKKHVHSKTNDLD